MEIHLLDHDRNHRRLAAPSGYSQTAGTGGPGLATRRYPAAMKKRGTSAGVVLGEGVHEQRLPHKWRNTASRGHILALCGKVYTAAFVRNAPRTSNAAQLLSHRQARLQGVFVEAVTKVTAAEPSPTTAL